MRLQISIFIIFDYGKNLLNRITSDAKVCGGKPCIREMRIRVMDVIELLATGLSANQIVTEELPDLEEDITACLLYAATKVNHPALVAARCLYGLMSISRHLSQTG
jgi:uncharacterized protein (DUF433 family)